MQNHNVIRANLGVLDSGKRILRITGSYIANDLRDQIIRDLGDLAERFEVIDE